MDYPLFGDGYVDILDPPALAAEYLDAVGRESGQRARAADGGIRYQAKAVQSRDIELISPHFGR